MKQERKEEWGRFLTLTEAMGYLGVKYKIIRRILDSGTLPYRKVGNRYLIDRETLRKWVNFIQEERN